MQLVAQDPGGGNLPREQDPHQGGDPEHEDEADGDRVAPLGPARVCTGARFRDVGPLDCLGHQAILGVWGAAATTSPGSEACLP